MASGDIKIFTQKMISEKVFTCAICNNLLKIPVMITDDGNVCQKCIDSEDETEGITVPNTALNTLLKELKFPCKYQCEGCDQDILYESLQDHENKCIYRSIRCLIPKEECEWIGKVVDLSKHFTEEHSKHIVTGPFNEFYFEFNISKNLNIIKLLKNKTKTYIIKITGMGDNVLSFLQDTRETNDEFKVNIKFVGENGEHKIKLRLLPFCANFDENDGKKVLLSTLKEIRGAGDNIQVHIKAEKRQIKNLNSEVLKHLECVVCKDLMRPPILQCPTGHSICEACRNKLKECPTCRQVYDSSKTRNFSLEAFTASVQYPCVYNQFGCTATFLGIQIAKHEENCEYKIYKCPIVSCNFVGNYLSCKSHFKVNHADSLIEGFELEYFTPLGYGVSATTIEKYIFQHSNIYKYIFKRDTMFCSWNISILNTYDSSKKYFYEIIITDQRVKQSRMIKSSLCQKGTPVDTKGITFKYEDLTLYKNPENDQIHFKCEIFEQVN